MFATLCLFPGCKDSILGTVCSVTYDPNGGTIGNDTVREYTVGMDVYYHPEVRRDGYVCIGWNRDKNANVGFPIVIEEGEKSLTVYAIWGHKVEFDANGESGYMPEQHTLLGRTTSLDSNKFTTNRDKGFIGWNTDKSASSILYHNSERLNIDRNLYLYAIWQDAIIDTANNLKYLTSDDGFLRVYGYIDDTKDTISIPSSYAGTTINAIGDRAFYLFSNPVSISIPDSITKIGARAFGSTKITSIVIPDSVTEIGASLFSFCTKLSSVTLSENLTKIPDSAFEVCDKLSAITIPEKVETIGASAFKLYSGTGLKELTLKRWKSGETNEITKLDNVNALPKTIQHIYVPSGSLDAYKADPLWQNFASKIEVKI